MNSKMLIAGGLLTVLVLSCMPPAPDSGSYAGAFEDAQILQQYLPAIEASLSLVEVSDDPPASVYRGGSVSLPADADGPQKTIFPANAPGLPDDPDDMFDILEMEDGYARFPSGSGFIADFYGEAGNQAYMTLHQMEDGWGDYRVNLYVYPTLSPAVWYEIERYRVNGDSWTEIIDETGEANAIAYEQLTTYYFDGREENRDVVWSRWADAAPGDRYVASYFEIPVSFDDDDFDYPDSIVAPTKTTADFDDYAVEVHTTVTNKHRRNQFESEGVEFYMEDDNDVVVNKYSKSYFKERMAWGKFTHDTETVRYYSVDEDGNKVVRAKTVNEFSNDGSRTTTESIDITIDADVTSYDSQITAALAGDQSYEVEISLTETGVDTNIYTGTLIVGSRIVDVYLDSENGLEVEGQGQLRFRAHKVKHFDHSPFDWEQFVTFTTKNGRFVGLLNSGHLEGTYKTKKGKTISLAVGKSFTSVGGNTLQ